MSRVVITGMGIVSSLGDDIDTFWNNIKNGKNGIDFITSFDTSNINVKFAAEVKNFDTKLLNRRDLIFDSKFINYGRVASINAYKDSGLEKCDIDRDSFGVYIASSMGGIDKIDKGFKDLGNGKRLSPLLMPSILPNMVSGRVAIDLNARGSNMTHIAACSGGANAIGEAFLKIKDGYETIMVAGASDASNNIFAISCFSSMRVLYEGKNIEEASIPFDKRRKGFVIGEGAGIVILEEYNHAIKRNAKIYGEIVGYGCNCDAFNIVSPDFENVSCTKAMKKALKMANIKESDITYINAHGTSTILNDKTESKAINKIFKDRPYVSSTKSMTGHLLSASGAVESIITIKALQEGIIPPTINYICKDNECNINIVKNHFKKVKNMRYAMSNSLGFGGHNVSLIFKRWENE